MDQHYGHSTNQRIFNVDDPPYRGNHSTPPSGAQNNFGSNERPWKKISDRGPPTSSLNDSFNLKENKIKEEHNFWTDSKVNLPQQRNVQYSYQATNYDPSYQTVYQRNGDYSNQATNYPSSYQKGYQRNVAFQKSYAEQDVEQYRNEYPGKEDNNTMQDNILFYSNILGAQPERITIDEIHKKWWGNYDLLERNHTYIQWLFPIRETGLNSFAQELQLHEANRIKEDHKMSHRFVKSYGMMLDFYGMKLVEEQPSTPQQSGRFSREILGLNQADRFLDRFMKLRYTGEIEPNRNWKQRFDHLNRSAHNNLRITRMLKSLGEMGFDEYQFWFVYFILQQIFKHRRLKNCWTSCKDYWVPLLRNKENRDRLKKYIYSGRMH